MGERTGHIKFYSGEQIPLLSRIISVVDAFDAMINNRSYKSAMSFNDAIEELRRCSGTQFDPKIVDIFTRMLEREDLKAEEKTESKENSEAEESV